MTDLLEQALADTAKTAADVAKTGLGLAESTLKKVWTLAEAAVEKQAPSEYLSPKAIRAMQGKPEK
ncbi:MAG: hypothetical protein Fur0035_06750 [Anaerolineales bacterium]